MKTSIDEGRTRKSAVGRPTSAQLRDFFFNFLDLDFSGRVSDSELVDSPKKRGIRLTYKHAEHLIKMFDANNSGLMEFNELERLTDEIYR